jgi:dolichol-phosphate mannosyltransferase
MKPRVLAFFAAYNEESHVPKILERFGPVLKEGIVEALLVVDDGSTDKTPEILRRAGVATLRNEQRQGVGNAIRAAIAYAREHGYDVLAILAGNDKDRPGEIPRLLAPILDEGFDFVQGSRYLPGGDFGNMPLYRRLATQFVHPLLFSLITFRRITDSTNGFRAIRLSLFDDQRINIHQPWLNAYELEPYIFFKAIRLGYKVKEVPVSKIYPPHQLGYTKMKPITGWWSILRPLVFLGLGLKK